MLGEAVNDVTFELNNQTRNFWADENAKDFVATALREADIVKNEEDEKNLQGLDEW